MKRALFVLGLLLSTAAAANAAVCAVAAAGTSPRVCDSDGWMPNDPSGWTRTYHDYVPGPGWAKACTLPAGDGYCWKTQIPAGTWTVSALGDMDVTGAAGQWTGHIRYMQVNSNGPNHIYDNGTCFGGSFVATSSGLWTLNFGPGTGSTWDPSCMILRN